MSEGRELRWPKSQKHVTELNCELSLAP